jgi:DNA-binding NarL/FixJ family response regulator
MLTTFDLDRYVYDALAAGASGFLLKDVTPEHLVAAVRLVETGTHCSHRRSPGGSSNASRPASRWHTLPPSTGTSPR